MCSSRRSIWPIWGLTVCSRWRLAGPPITPRRCSSSTFTAISTTCNRAGGWSARPAAIRLVPDHKTIADFRKDNGPAIKKVCAQFVALCRKMGLLAKASVAIDGSKFKAVNSRDNNFTKGKMERRLAQIEESVARYLSQLDTADRQTAAGEAPSEELAARTTRLKEKLAKLEEEVKRLKAIEKEMLAAPDQQISFTDPDSRSMATSGHGSGMVGYNVQAAVDTTNHLIVAHEVTNIGTDKSQLANMANQAKAALGAESLEAFADRAANVRQGLSRGQFRVLVCRVPF
jgi:transposase